VQITSDYLDDGFWIGANFFVCEPKHAELQFVQILGLSLVSLTNFRHRFMVTTVNLYTDLTRQMYKVGFVICKTSLLVFTWYRKLMTKDKSEFSQSGKNSEFRRCWGVTESWQIPRFIASFDPALFYGRTDFQFCLRTLWFLVGSYNTLSTFRRRRSISEFSTFVFPFKSLADFCPYFWIITGGIVQLFGRRDLSGNFRPRRRRYHPTFSVGAFDALRNASALLFGPLPFRHRVSLTYMTWKSK